jgi:L-ribulose-5-phosphate 3-epimerase
MLLGYNTNGFAHHKLEDAVRIIAGCGYKVVALTPDVHHLNPFEPDLPFRTAELRELLDSLGLKCVIETGARFLLNAHHKHQPTLISPNVEDRAYRYEFLSLDAIGLAKELGAEVVSFWSGTATDDAPPSELMNRLVEQCSRLADCAASQGIRLAFEPEPGMFIDTMDRFAELHDRVNHPAFGLTLDIGHLVCLNEVPFQQHLQRWLPFLWNLHLDDMRRNIHDHLMFGEGDVNFAEFFTSAEECGITACMTVELSRHSHDAVATARRSFEFLARFLK